MGISCKKGHIYDDHNYEICPICNSKIKCINCENVVPVGNRTCSVCGINLSFRVVRCKSEIVHNANLRVPIGKSPDGLPWIININRITDRVKDFSILLNILEKQINGIIDSNLPVLSTFRKGAINEAIKDCLEKIENESIELQICEVTLTERGVMKGFIPISPIENIIQGTFLSETFKDKTLTSRSFYTREETFEKFPVSSPGIKDGEEQVKKFREFLEEMRYRKHLFIPMNENALYIAKLKKEDFSQPNIVRDFISESLLGIERVYAVFSYNEGIQDKTDLKDQENYLKNLLKVRHQGGAVRYTFDKQQVGKLIVNMAQGLYDMHRSGRVHCDIKPENILLTEKGLVPFDSQEVKIGGISLCNTFTWASPEQIIGKEVSPASDIFSTAQIWLKILDGISYGEKTTFTIPVFRGEIVEIRNFKIFKDPIVYVPANEGQSIRWQQKWQEFFKKCFVFDPEKRIIDMNVFSDMLNEMLEEYPIPGSMSISPYWGKLNLYFKETKELFLGWEIRDDLYKYLNR